MSITDELRQYAYGYETMVNHRLLGIADRIDLAHERAIADAELCAAPTEGQMEELGYVALPVDADGVPIHVGDVMEGYGKTIEVVELRYGRSGWVLISGDGNGYADTSAFAHHHSPTVVDMLYEMYDRLDDPSGDDRNRTIEEIVTEYAAKLQLREGA